MGRTASNAPGYAPTNSEDEFDPLADDFVSKERNYLHFDRALTEDARSKVRATDEAILRQSFWPLLGFTKSERRTRRDSNGNVTFEVKDREIKFGSHADAALLEAYARRLALHYELALQNRSISHCVLAYRRSVGDNISQAKSLFEEIASRGDAVAVAIDIRKFFDKISHAVLLENLREVLEIERLIEADFAIYSRMTKFEWVDADQLAEALAGKRRPAGRLCDALQFREIVRGEKKLITRNKDPFGIPQGTPLSGLYANISLLAVDCELDAHMKALGGSYRRYSDDIALVAPSGTDPKALLDKIGSTLGTNGLAIAENKTAISIFSTSGGSQSADKEFQYLGFTFDGRRILIRQSSLNKYYAKMSRGIKSKIRAAKKQGITRDTMFLRQLFKSYTHFGRHRNFPRYAYRASRILKSVAIRKQLRNHMKIFKRSLKYYLDRAY